MRKILMAGVTAVLSLLALMSWLPSAASASSAGHKPKPTLAEILLSDKAKDGPDGFDRNSYDYDIVTQAVLLFPDLVAAASDPNAQLTVFLPTDAAFRRLVYDLTGHWYRSEAEIFKNVAALGTDTVKNVLQYHIVGSGIPYSAALKSDNAVLATLLAGSTITVDVRHRQPRIKLIDADTNDYDARVIRPNVGGAASNGYAHGIDRALRPVDLP